MIEEDLPFDLELKIKREIKARAKYCCERCRKKEAYTTEEFNIHHILPLKDGGKTILSNLIYLCRSCHKEIHKQQDGFDIDKYRENIQQNKDITANVFVNHSRKPSINKKHQSDNDSNGVVERITKPKHARSQTSNKSKKSESKKSTKIIRSTENTKEGNKVSETISNKPENLDIKKTPYNSTSHWPKTVFIVFMIIFFAYYTWSSLIEVSSCSDLCKPGSVTNTYELGGNLTQCICQKAAYDGIINTQTKRKMSGKELIQYMAENRVPQSRYVILFSRLNISMTRQEVWKQVLNLRLQWIDNAIPTENEVSDFRDSERMKIFYDGDSKVTKIKLNHSGIIVMEK